MKISKEAVQQNRKRVLDTAARLFRERGIDGIGIADLMQEAGLTHGGFYRQFKSKDDLIVRALEGAFADTSKDIESRVAADDKPFEALVRYYVSAEHRDDPGHGCSLAALASDAARDRDGDLAALFGDIVAQYITLLTAILPGTDPERKRADAVSALAEMVGSLVLSRVVPDPALATEIIETVADDLIARHATPIA